MKIIEKALTTLTKKEKKAEIIKYANKKIIKYANKNIERNRAQVSAVSSFVIENELDVNSVTYQGVPLLHQAILTGSLNTIKILVAHGADVNLKDKFGYTPIKCRFFFSQLYSTNIKKEKTYDDIHKFLISKGAKNDTNG